VGGGEPIRVDVRILAATNKDLRAEAAAARFREDLFFRLHVIPLHLPPLRDRADDVPLLAEHLLARIRARHALPPPRLSAGAMEALARHPWPGNVRELANILERISILHAGAEVGPAEVRALLAGAAPRRPPAPPTATTTTARSATGSTNSSARCCSARCRPAAGAWPRPPGSCGRTAPTSTAACAAWGSNVEDTVCRSRASFRHVPRAGATGDSVQVSV
jgi:DNA-binding NtrC family response regulator